MSPVLRAGPVAQARYEALRILVRVETDRAFADITLEHALDRAALEARDAALCTEIVYGTLRWQRHLDWRDSIRGCERCCVSPPIRFSSSTACPAGPRWTRR